MKNKLLAFGLLLICASALAQGTVIFNNRIAGTLITHVYGTDPANIELYQTGFGPNDLNQPGGSGGTLVWGGPPLAGSGWSAQLFDAPGANQPESSLMGAAPVTSFRTGAAAGWVAGTTATLTGVSLDAPVATMVLRVWDNMAGTITSWDSAIATGAVTGESPLFNVSAIGGTLNPAPALIGLQSFNITLVIPEPSAWALGSLGALLLLSFYKSQRGFSS